MGGAGGQSHSSGAGAGGVGVYIDRGELIAVSGTIAGGYSGLSVSPSPADAVQFAGPGRLEVYGGAHFIGAIIADPLQNDTLVLAGGAPGTLADFSYFSAITEKSHANWALDASIAGTGTITIGQDSTLSLAGTISTAAVAFTAGGTNHLVLDTPASFTSVIGSFGTGDTIDLAGISAASLTYQSGLLTLFGANGAPVDTLTFTGTLTAADFVLHSGTEGTTLSFGAPAMPSLMPSSQAMAFHF